MNNLNGTLKIIGYGNPGRQDDGLGIALVERIENWINFNPLDFPVFTDYCYQLNIEDASSIADNDLVIFADASKGPIVSFSFSEITGNRDVSFTSHGVSPEYVVGLCNELYGKCPRAYLLEIKGYEWEFYQSLSEMAEKNLDLALEFITNLLVHPTFPVINYHQQKN